MVVIRNIVNELFKLHSVNAAMLQLYELIGKNIVEQVAVDAVLTQLKSDKERIKKRIRSLVETL